MQVNFILISLTMNIIYNITATNIKLKQTSKNSITMKSERLYKVAIGKLCSAIKEYDDREINK